MTYQSACFLKHKKFTDLCHLFEKQVLRNPNGIAAIFEGFTITYLELDQRSNQLARYLRANGVQSETLVGLSLYNGLDLLVGILGILKSGGGYLPLDPHYPKERIRYMLEDAKPVLLLTEPEIDFLLEGSGYKTIQITDADQMENTPLGGGFEPNQLAYVIYTSGSTGKPKGIMVEHASLTHAAIAHQGFYPEKPIALMSSGISFDPSLLIIFHTLIAGGIVCIPNREEAIDAEKTIDVIEKHSINFLLCVPSFYGILLDKSRLMPSLKSVSLAGEVIPNSLLMKHADLAPNAFLYNEYGPSEYAIGTTIGKIFDPEFKKIYDITVGKPLPSTEVHILDEDLQPVAKGEKGELFIGGVGVARGYLNQLELTSEKFINAQNLLYRTGDYGRLLSDEQIEFLGRKDFQVKIRGHRVELGEIEAVACKCPEIDEAFVIVQEDNSGHKRLALYFSSLKEQELSGALKIYLNEQLPKHMVPSAFLQMKKWPRTLNGKIDRVNLPEIPQCTALETTQSLSFLEQEIFSVWKEVLNREHFSPHDNFFDLGGDSLQIAEVQTLFQTRLGIEIGVTQLFQCPTIFLLAKHLSSEKKVEGNSAQELAEKRKVSFNRFKKKSS